MRRCSRTVGLCNVEPALKHYCVKRDIIERLVASDPSNATWQIDLASAYGSIGSALHIQGHLAAALENYRLSFAIVERLAMTDPANADWQTELGLEHAQIGIVLAAQGQSEPALKAIYSAREIMTKLAPINPNSIVLQDSLRVFDELIAELEKPKASAETAKSIESGTVRDPAPSEKSPPVDKKVPPKTSRKAPVTWQQELWKRQ